MKYETHSEYKPQTAAFSEAALLTLWPILEPWQDDLVLVGGLVPRYICGDVASPRDLPRPVTMDADFGIGLDASAGGMSSLKMALADAQFHQTKSAEGLIRYEKQVGQFFVPVDFLTDAPPNTRGSVMVDDIIASVLPGVDRALKIARLTKIVGTDLAGHPQSATVRDEQSSAPIRAAIFVLGQALPGESDDIQMRRLQIRQDMVSAGELLRKAIAASQS